MGAPFVSQEHLALAGSRNILHLLEERELAPAGRNRELPYQELSSHFMLLLEAETPSVHGNTPLTPDEKRELPHAGAPFVKLITRKR